VSGIHSRPNKFALIIFHENLVEHDFDVVAGVPVADTLLRVLADRQVSPTVLNSSPFAMPRFCAGNLATSIPPSLRFGATGRVHQRLNEQAAHTPRST
jgi:hypothetical protein